MSIGLDFLQISDVHFGAPLSGGKLQLPTPLVQSRSSERRAAFARAMDIVIERDLDGVLIPGDLFDDESIDTDTLHFVLHHLERVARPVFIAPGNHDPYGGASPYAGSGARNARGIAWSENVHVFAHEDFREQVWPDRPEIQITGCGVPANTPMQERRLAERIPRSAAELNVMLFHGSRDDGRWLQAHKSTHPFSSEELLAQEFDWVALGHYHGAQMIRDDGGRARAAYAGCAFAGGLDETGTKGALLVTLSSEDCHVEFVPLDDRQVRRVECDLTGANFREAAVEKVLSSFEESGAGSDDLVLLEVGGMRAKGLDLSFLDELHERFHYLKVDRSGLRPDLDLDRYPTLEEATNTEERFVARLRPALEGSDGDLYRRALLYGLDAIENGRLEQRYEA